MSRQNQTAAPANNEAQVESAKDITKVDLSKCSTTSAKMRALSAAGFTTGDIAKHLGKRYQHVRNVLITPVKTPKQ